MVTARVMALLLIVPALAGCANEVSTPGRLDTIDHFEEFSWKEPRVIGSGESPFGDGTEPHYVQQMVPLTGWSPVGAKSWDSRTRSPFMAVDSEGGVYTMTAEHVLKSSDHGASWDKVLDFRPMFDPQLSDGWISVDQTLWIDSPSQTIYVGFTSASPCQVLFVSQDFGASWETRAPNDWPASCFDGRSDYHSGVVNMIAPFIVTAPHRGPAELLPRQAPHTLYWCEEVYSFGSATEGAIRCSTSWDGGRTFVHEALLSPPAGPCMTTSMGKPAVRSDGVVAVPLGPRDLNRFTFSQVEIECDQEPEISFSQDGGLTWEVVSAPQGMVQREASPSLAFTPDGTAYLAYRNNESQIQVLRSPDLFQTWDGPFNVTLPEHRFGVHPAVTVGDDGRVAVAYLASSTPQRRGEQDGQIPAVPETADSATLWHLFVATTLDATAAEPSWHVQQVTPKEDPIHMGCIRDLSGHRIECLNMGQFTDMATGDDGRSYAVRIDGCTPRNGCSTDDEGAYAYRDRQVMIASLDQGTSLLAEAGVLPSVGLVHPPPIHEEAEIYAE